MEQVHCVVEARNTLGEVPVWDIAEQVCRAVTNQATGAPANC